jgi:hypothetical protein
MAFPKLWPGGHGDPWLFLFYIARTSSNTQARVGPCVNASDEWGLLFGKNDGDANEIGFSPLRKEPRPRFFLNRAFYCGFQASDGSEAESPF